MKNIQELVYWNQKSYGSAIKISKDWIRLIMLIFFVITPFTNWMLPFVGKIVRKDIVLRF